MRPSVTVSPSGVSLRDNAELSSSFGIIGVPHGVALEQLDSLDAGLAAAAALHHALQAFERVKVHRVRPAHSDHHGRFDFAVQREVDRGQAPGHRNRAAGEHREAQASRGVHHRLRLFEAVGEVLVVVYRDGAAVLFKDLHDFLEELVARIELLALLVTRIIAVLADHQDGVDREFVAAAAERLGDASGRP